LVLFWLLIDSWRIQARHDISVEGRVLKDNSVGCLGSFVLFVLLSWISFCFQYLREQFQLLMV